MLQIPVERVEGLLLWRDPYASAKVFGAGLYMLICLRHLVCGERSLKTLPESISPNRGTVKSMPACLARRPDEMHGCHGSLAGKALTCVCKQVRCRPSMALCMLWVCRVGLPSPEPSRSRASALGRTSKPHTVTGRAGVELLQPSTALAGLALFALLYCALARLWSTRRSPLKQILDRHPLPHEEESRLQASFSCKALMLRGLILGITCAGTQRAMPSSEAARNTWQTGRCPRRSAAALASQCHFVAQTPAERDQ